MSKFLLVAIAKVICTVVGLASAVFLLYIAIPRYDATGSDSWLIPAGVGIGMVFFCFFLREFSLLLLVIKKDRIEKEKELVLDEVHLALEGVDDQEAFNSIQLSGFAKWRKLRDRERSLGLL